MVYNNKRHLPLVEESLNLKKQNKIISIDNPEANKELRFYQILGV